MLLICISAGCGGGAGDGRFDVSGEIQLDGKPVPAGEIMFEPDTSKGNKGPAGVAEIKDGKYHTLPGKGTVGGPHIAVISATNGQAPKDGDDQSMVLLSQYHMPVELPKASQTLPLKISTSDIKKKK